MMNGNGNYRDVLIDAGIAAGSAVFGVFLGAPTDLSLPLRAALIAGGVAFFGSLVAARRRTAKRGPPRT